MSDEVHYARRTCPSEVKGVHELLGTLQMMVQYITITIPKRSAPYCYVNLAGCRLVDDSLTVKGDDVNAQ